MRNFTLTLIAALAILWTPVALEAQTHIRGQILLQTNRPIDAAFLSATSPGAARQKAAFGIETLSEYSHFYKIAFDTARFNDEDLLKFFNQQPFVIAAQFNHRLEPRKKTPNDPLYASQWALPMIHAPELWDITTGGRTSCGDTIVIAIFDEGFDVNHEDLKDNIWHNSHEIPNNGIDDDGNGYIDDYNGWNYLGKNDSIIYNTSHGTSVAGVAGAKGNNGKELSGVNWNIKLMLLSDVSGTEANLVKAYSYAADMRRRYNQSGGKQGAFVAATSMSLGLTNSTAADHAMWCNMYDTLGVQGIINVVAAANDQNTVESLGDIPSLCNSKYKIVVTSTTQQDALAASYSATRVALGAPGDNVLTLNAGNNSYRAESGASFAAPLVAGAVALLYSAPSDSLCRSALRAPGATADRVTNDLLKGVDAVPALQGKTVSGGRLNVFNSYQLLAKDFGTYTALSETAQPIAAMRVYPNPASQGIVSTEWSAPGASGGRLDVINLTGQVVFSKKLSDGEWHGRRAEIDAYLLSGGIYFITLTTNDNVRKTMKLVVQK